MFKRLPYGLLNKLMVFIVIILTLLIGLIIYISGGTSMAFTHLMYIPIIISAYFFEMKGAAAIALFSGLILGPWMPRNINSGFEQEPISWLFRIIMFLAIGIMTSSLFRYIKNLRDKEIKASLQHITTGLPNGKQLKLDLAEMIDTKNEFSLIGFKITNIDDINRYAGYEIGIKAILKTIDILADRINTTVYSIYSNEFAAIIPTSDQNPYIAVMDFLDRLKEPLSIDKFKMQLIVKCGVAIPAHKNENANDMIKKMGIALGSETNVTGFVVYDSSLEEKNKEKYEITASLFEAIKNNEFYIVYQPKMSLDDNCEMGVEALLRWNHSSKGQISPEIFIKLAEENGFINEITKWVIENVLNQIEKWQSEGLSIKVAINISSKDLINSTIIDHLKLLLEQSRLDPAMIELELTERSDLNNDNIRQHLNELIEYGIKTSLDDFGTGYNSLVDLIMIPFDYLKVDKIFIDNITNNVNRIITENIINFAHKTGIKVIAEGVENQKQLEILKSIDCDYIQGYYFSKPLLPGEIKEIYLTNVR